MRRERTRLHPHGPIAIDATDVHLLTSRAWYRNAGGYLRANEASASARARGATKPSSVMLHRLIADAPNGFFVDHINGDILDNRRCNLRVCTRIQNSRNQARTVRNKSGYKGVSHRPRSGRDARPYQAAICVDKRTHYLGSYAAADEAARAYDRAALEHFVEFARLNFPHTQERAA